MISFSIISIGATFSSAKIGAATLSSARTGAASTNFCSARAGVAATTLASV